MTYGQVARSGPLPVFFGLWLLLISGCLPLSARHPSASAQGMPVTILAVGAHSVQVMGEDGRAETVAFSPASAFLRRGLLVRAGEFLPGETVLLRRRTGAGGTGLVGLLCDPDSAAAQEKARGRALTGTILSLSAQVLVVLPAEGADSVPLSLLVSAGTRFTIGGAKVTESAFEPGASVTIITRGLPSGLLSLVSVTEAVPSDAPKAETTHRVEFVSGLVTEVQPSTLTVRDKIGVSHTIGADSATRVKVRKQPAALADIAAGMRVSVWLGSREDAAANPLATTVSAYDAPDATGKRKR